MFDDMETIDAAEAEAKMRAKAPGVLPDNEHLIMAFKLRNYKLMFTPYRILTKDSSVINTDAHEYNSLPYRNVAAFSVCTAGTLDTDTELEIYSKNSADKISLIKKDFKKNKVDLFAILHLLNQYVLGAQDPFGLGIADEKVGATLSAPVEADQQGVRDFLGGNAAELVPEEVEEQLKLWMLVPNEKVRIAYKSGRDMAVFTTKRIILIDKKGITGKSVEYMSVLYSHVRMFSVESAGGGIFDRDAEVELYTDIPCYPIIKQDLKKNCNLLNLQMFLTDLVCGVGGGTPAMSPEASSVDLGGGDYYKSLPKWMAGEGNAGQMDAGSADQQFHEPPNNILQDEERVEMAYKGRKDFMLFTTKRILFVDNKTNLLGGKKVNYLTIPYFSVSHFAVQTPGRGLIFKDRDAELQLWTDSCHFQHEVRTDDGTQPPEPLVTFIEQDLASEKVDLLAIHRYLSHKLLSLGPQPIQGPQENVEAPVTRPLIPFRPDVPGEDSVWARLHEMFSDNAHELPAAEMNAKFHENGMLQEDESVGLAFANGRDLFMVTTKRIFCMDTKGMTGKKVQYLTIPFSSVRSFGVQSASTFDRDCEFFIDVKGFWNTFDSPAYDSSINSRITQDLSKGQCDIMAIHNFMSDRCILHFADQTSFTQDIPPFQPFDTKTIEGAGAKFLSFMDRDNMAMLSSEEVADLNQRLRLDPPVLLPEGSEYVELGFQRKKDLMLFTNLRILHIDRKKQMRGLTGEKMEYTSIPWPTVHAFGFQAAGNWADSDSEMKIYRDVTNDGKYSFDLKKGCSNQPVINRWLDNKIIYKY